MMADDPWAIVSEKPVPPGGLNAASADPWASKAAADIKARFAPQPSLPAGQMTAAERFGTGLKDPIEGGAQLLASVIPTSVEKKVNRLNNWLADLGLPLEKLPEGGMTQEVKNREAAIKASSPPGFDLIRLAGAVASPVNYVIPEMRAGKIAQTAAEGAWGAGLQPVAEGAFVPEKIKQVAGGLIAGGAMGAAGKAAKGLIAPEISKDAKELIDAGVKLTPGQVLGGSGRRVEEIAKNAPIVGTGVRNAESAAIDSFNRATVNKALEPLGAAMPEGVVGRDLIARGQEALHQAYGALLPKMSFQEDAPFIKSLDDMRPQILEIPPDQRAQFLAILKNRISGRLDENGVMSGESLKSAESDLSHLAMTYKSSADAAQQQLGHALDSVNDAVRDALERQNPEHAEELRNINRSFAMFTRIENAAVRRAAGEGRFTPKDLLQAVKSGDKTIRKKAFARGDALLQDWAETGNRVISDRLPDTGTAERTIGMDVVPAIAAGAIHPSVLLPAAGLRGVYSGPGTAAVRNYATPSAGRAELAEALQRYLSGSAPGVGAAVPAALRHIFPGG